MKGNAKMLELIVWYITTFGCGLLFYGIGVFAKKREKPDIFIDDAQVEVDEKVRQREDTAKGSGGSVVYDPDDAGVNAVQSTSKPLIADSSQPQANSGITPPPPPPSGGVVAAPPGASAAGTPTSTDNSIPALF